ncbi:rhodanese-like domain-containing protein [Halobacteriales archaeon QH_2_65_14]|nr:MAG: rhodanese-like domain-containing protein [Halobacteriales archaeon QH_2_65_14]
MDAEISPAELETALENGEGPVVVDIRNPEEFRRGHIPDSINVPLSRLPREVDRLRGADHVVTVCPHGKASVRAARLITSFEGFHGRVESLESGLAGWDGPLEAPTGDAKGPASDSPDAPF